jgi:hypothetical protein
LLPETRQCPRPKVSFKAKPSYRLGGEIRLSPANDPVPTALLLPEDKEETALTLNGITDFNSVPEATRLHRSKWTRLLIRPDS